MGRQRERSPSSARSGDTRVAGGFRRRRTTTTPRSLDDPSEPQHEGVARGARCVQGDHRARHARVRASVLSQSQPEVRQRFGKRPPDWTVDTQAVVERHQVAKFTPLARTIRDGREMDVTGRSDRFRPLDHFRMPHCTLSRGHAQGRNQPLLFSPCLAL